MLTDGRTDGWKIGRLYRTLLQAGVIKTTVSTPPDYGNTCLHASAHTFLYSFSFDGEWYPAPTIYIN